MKKNIFLIAFLCSIVTFSQNYKFGKVSKEELKEQFHPLDSTANSAYLFKKRRTYYSYNNNEGFVIITEIHERIKIYNKKGFDEATKELVYYKPDVGRDESIGAIKGYTFTLENGKVVKTKLEKNEIFTDKLNEYRSAKKITMPNIKVGAVIELRYKLYSPYSGVRDLEFQYGIPVKKLDYKIEIPEFFKYNKRNKGYYFIPMKQKSKRGSIGSIDYTVEVSEFQKNDIPALKDDEPFVNNIDNYRGGMAFELSSTDFVHFGGSYKSFSTSWESVSRQIYNASSFGTELDRSSYYRDDLKEIVAVAKTDHEKVSAILNFVKNKVKWNKNYGKYTRKGVRKAYKERSGSVAEINLMLTSMLRSAGLNANPVLVSTRDNGIPFFPTLDGFNYVISIVEFSDNSYILLDASETYSLPNLLPKRALNWNGRVIYKGEKSAWISLTSSKPSTEEETILVKIQEDLSVEGLHRTKYSNLAALHFRSNRNHIKEEELITEYEERYGVETDLFKIANQKNLGKPISRSVKFISDGLIEEINGKLYIEPMLFLTVRKNPFKLNDRKFPVDFTTPWKDKTTISIEIPAGYKVESIPETIAIGLPEKLGVFKYQVLQSGKKIKLLCILQINKAVISPTYYAGLKGFYGEVVKKQTEKIVLIRE